MYTIAFRHFVFQNQAVFSCEIYFIFRNKPKTPLHNNPMNSQNLIANSNIKLKTQDTNKKDIFIDWTANHDQLICFPFIRFSPTKIHKTSPLNDGQKILRRTKQK